MRGTDGKVEGQEQKVMATGFFVSDNKIKFQDPNGKISDSSLSVPQGQNPTALVNQLNTEYGKNMTFTGNSHSSMQAAERYAPGVAGIAVTDAPTTTTTTTSATPKQQGAAAILGGPANNADFSVEDYGALTLRMRLLTEASKIYAELYGYIVKPRVDRVTGNIIGYDPILDDDGKQVPTQVSIKQKADVDKIITDNELARAAVTGKVKNPQDPTGNTWIDTPAALLQAAEANFRNNETRIKNQELLSAALADPNRFVEAYTKANLSGTRLQGTAAQGGEKLSKSTSAPASGADPSGVSINTSAADAALGNAAAPGSVPVAMGNTRASGTSAPAADASNPSQVSANMEVNQENINALRNKALMPISANLDAALGGKYVGSASSVSNSGTAGMKTLSNINPASGNYAKINPVVYNNLDPFSQGQYNSLALANQGIDKDSLKKTVAGQMGGSSGGVPAAFRLR